MTSLYCEVEIVALLVNKLTVQQVIGNAFNHSSLTSGLNPTWTRGVLRDVSMNSKLLDNFNYDPIEPLVKYFFELLPELFRKLTPPIFSIEKTKQLFFSFLEEKTLIIISEFNFSENFFEVHIFIDQKIKILETHPDFLTFSAKTHNHL